jgi:hypothetical protein
MNPQLDQTVRHHPHVSGVCPLTRLVLRLSSYPFGIVVELWQSLSPPSSVDVQPPCQPSPSPSPLQVSLSPHASPQLGSDAGDEAPLSFLARALLSFSSAASLSFTLILAFPSFTFLGE